MKILNSMGRSERIKNRQKIQEHGKQIFLTLNRNLIKIKCYSNLGAGEQRKRMTRKTEIQRSEWK